MDIVSPLRNYRLVWIPVAELHVAARALMSQRFPGSDAFSHYPWLTLRTRREASQELGACLAGALQRADVRCGCPGSGAISSKCAAIGGHDHKAASDAALTAEMTPPAARERARYERSGRGATEHG
jgi:hypothetical protein